MLKWQNNGAKDPNWRQRLNFSLAECCLLGQWRKCGKMPDDTRRCCQPTCGYHFAGGGCLKGTTSLAQRAHVRASPVSQRGTLWNCMAFGLEAQQPICLKPLACPRQLPAFSNNSHSTATCSSILPLLTPTMALNCQSQS